MSWTELSREERKDHARKLMQWITKTQREHIRDTPEHYGGDIPMLTISARRLSIDLNIPTGLVINFLDWIQERDDLEWFVRVIN